MKALMYLCTGVTGMSAALLLGAGALAQITSSATAAPGMPAGVDAPSSEAVTDIPAVLLPIFVREAAECPGLPWTVLAGISRVESNHGRHGGSVVSATGAVQPPIIGVALDGTNGTARIPDSDDGRWDGDTVWDRAVGPFQFIPSSWRIFGGDGNADGVADPNNVLDAVPAMRRHLCPEGRVTDLDAAIHAYNHSDEYVADVLAWSARYSAAPASGGRSLPVPPTSISDADLVAPHHDYPAVDLGVPVGTPVLAITSGVIQDAVIAGVYPNDPNQCGSTVVLNGDDGATYTYCHLSLVGVSRGQRVDAASPIGAAGGSPGTAGAGNTTGPHLHLSIEASGRAVCPQPLLVAIRSSAALDVEDLPSTGCIDGEPPTALASWPSTSAEAAP